VPQDKPELQAYKVLQDRPELQVHKVPQVPPVFKGPLDLQVLLEHKDLKAQLEQPVSPVQPGQLVLLVLL
jgi:hypothetical protein